MPRQKKPANDSDSKASEATIIPVAEEALETGTRRVVTGRVRVRKRVEEHTEKVEVPVTRAEVEVRRVPANRIVDIPPAVRREGDAVIVPIVEEQVVIAKQLVLKEEIHVITRRRKENRREFVRLRRERADVERGGP